MLDAHPLNPILPAQEGAIKGPITDYGAVKSAWLRDSEGNVLALNEVVGDL